VNKHLLPVFDKPLIFYSLSTLMFAGARDIAVVSSPADLDSFRRIFHEGDHLGLRITYITQPNPRGIGDALARCSDFIGDDRCVVVLGDNLFHGNGFGMSLSAVDCGNNATIFAYRVADPRPYAVIEFGPESEPKELVEKPDLPSSKWAVPGLYFFPPGAADRAVTLPLSRRGETEITDLNRRYLQEGALRVIRASRGSMWTDVGSPERLFFASAYVESLVRRQGLSISCPEEVALRNGWLDGDAFAALAHEAPKSVYGDYLRSLAASGN
jgi:glucose-1-phosphate thymidylyltransferase